jgi:hypothetical protein
VTFTVTEAGYFFVTSSKALDFSQSCIQHDIVCPDKPILLVALTCAEKGHETIHSPIV